MYSTCKRCDKPTGEAYSSGHMVQSNLGLAFAPLDETNLFSHKPVVIFRSLKFVYIVGIEGNITSSLGGPRLQEFMSSGSKIVNSLIHPFREALHTDFQGNRGYTTGLFRLNDLNYIPRQPIIESNNISFIKRKVICMYNVYI